MATFTSFDDVLEGGFSFFSQDHYDAPYQLYRANNKYVFNSGKVMMPVAGTDPLAGAASVASRRVQLAQPYGFRIYSWAVERQDARPVLPHPAPQNPDNEEFLEGEISVYPPIVDATGGVHSWFVCGRFRYGLLVPVFNGSRYVAGVGLLVDLLRAGGTPYDVTLPDENVYSPEDFVPLQ